MGRHRLPAGHGLRAAIVTAALALGSLAALAGEARAETLTANCLNLQSQLTAAGAKLNHGEGDTVVLEGLCKGSGFTLPAGSAFALQGAAGTSSGIDGTGTTGSLLSGEKLGSFTISGLEFENGTGVGNGTNAVNLSGERLTLVADTFQNNSHEGVAGGALEAIVGSPCPVVGAPALAISGSTFRNNTNTIVAFTGGGGAVFVADACKGAENLLAGNVFEGNTVHVKEEPQLDVGGAVYLISESAPSGDVLNQGGNVFAGNRITAPAGEADYGGGGEWVTGFSLASVGDRFSGNTIPGTSGAGKWSWGAGLGLLACSNTEPTVSSLQDAVIEGNTIGAGEPADLGGAGMYVGCTKKETPNHVSLLDSTVTGNAVGAGGVAGVAGGPHDQLQIANSIVAGDTGGSETGGFAGEGGSLTASFSDVCNAAGTAPLPGEGNICANPLLADNGTPASFDVHETGASPTIDAGRNPLVPGGLRTDYFGGPRIVEGTVFTACGAALFGPPIVDMGAAEAPAGTHVHALSGECFPHLPPRPPQLSAFAFPAIAQGVNGVLTLAFRNLAAGRVSVKATYKRTRTLLVKVKGRRRHVHRTETRPYGTASYTGSSSANAKIRLKPTAQALKLLARVKRLKVLVTITFTQTGRLPAAQSKTITVRYKPPPRRHKHH